MNDFPLLRNVQASVGEHDGRRMVTFFDPANFCETPISVSLPAFFVMSMMDGSRSVEILCEEFEAQFGQPMEPGEVAGLVHALDEAYLLDNERFRGRKKAVTDEFNSLKTRPAAFAGKSYPDDSAELKGVLDSLLKSAATDEPANGLKAVVVPHIDFRVGGDMMAAGWSRAAKSGAELFIILGIGHALTDDFFACIDKDFETPAGTMRVDGEFIANFSKNFGEDILGNAHAHRTEHSIEFAALFMAHIFGRNPAVTAVPILLSFPEEALKMDHPLFNVRRIAKFIEALKKTVSESGRKACYAASVDFAHVGQRFGDSHAVDGRELDRIKTDDTALLSALARIDNEAFVNQIERKNKTNRVCGFPALYTLIAASGARSGQVLGYRQNVEGENENVVSFATMALHG
ncbi:MAG: AmmeMemoRadiSam system protein B [Nitrospinae bacterium]|nr:AmmeMemoRadiSam system protein B [Nitrospinota bacterium]